jgi:uncharacterized cupredoxin-like copper-binding protein
MVRAVPLMAAVLAALVAGCGSSSSSSSGGSTGGAGSSSGGGSSLSLTESELKISPASDKVSATGTITITVQNKGAVVHALAVQTPSGIVRTGQIAPGKSATLTVHASKAGSYTLFCPIDHHRKLGMQGTLVVGSGTAAASSSTSTSGGHSSYGY